ncbi:MAG TPA: SLC13 family permease [Tissierellia bacterium]|nr:SLC13 family permease [Tissierellia bacterium]
MTLDQGLIFALLAVMLFFFAQNKIRFEIVALSTLMIAVFLGLVPRDQAFTGFGHNAVVTVAAVLVMSQALIDSGFVEIIAHYVSRFGKTQHAQLGILMLGVALFSSIMNNIGALALFMPVGIQMARQNNYSPSYILMPLAFASLFGGMITLIGSPPNIIISEFRREITGEAFAMFQFAPIGLSITIGGILMILAFGWRLIPVRKGQISRDDLFSIKEYTTVVRVNPESVMANKTIREVDPEILRRINIISHVRPGLSNSALNPYRIISPGDKLILACSAEALAEFLKKSKTELSGSKQISTEDMRGDGMTITEIAIPPSSGFINHTAKTLDLRSRFHINLLAIARQGERLGASPNRIRIRAGDVLLIQGTMASIQELINDLDALPLAERKIDLKQNQRTILAFGIFALALLVVALEIMPADVTFVIAAILMVLTRVTSIQSAMHAIDLPIIFLLGALIPVSQALETTGAANLLAELLMGVTGSLPTWGILALLLSLTLILTNIINNAAAALLLAPVAVGLANIMGHSIDPYLLSVFVGATSAYLTPIGHASCTVVMGPGGYRFSDYWKLGLPLSILTVLIAIPVILALYPV